MDLYNYFQAKKLWKIK